MKAFLITLALAMMLTSCEEVSFGGDSSVEAPTGRGLRFYSYEFSDAVYKYQGVSYNNNNHKINPGEIVSMALAIHNTESACAYNMKVTLICASEYISITSIPVHNWWVDAGMYQITSCSTPCANVVGIEDKFVTRFGAEGTFKIAVARNCPKGTIPITVCMTTSSWPSSTDTFYITIE